MMFFLTGLFLGSLVCCFLRRREDQKRIAQLEFDKEMLLDFNEKLIRDREEVESRCVLIPKDEDWPEIVL